jgi:cysteinyl-tRNA synthetase
MIPNRMLSLTLLLILSILAAKVSGFVSHHSHSRSLAAQRQCSSSSATSTRDEYDEFALEFESLLRSSDWDQPAVVSDKSVDDAREISPFYRRDKRDYQDAKLDSDIADPVGLQRLLKERFEARRSKNFELVTAADRQLKRQHGVRAFDHPPIWTRSSEAPLAHLRRKAQTRSREMKQLYGPTGHPYRQVGKQTNAAGESLLLLTESQAHDSLSRRTRCRMEGRYEEADAIKFELSLYGIRIHEGYFQWTVDDQYCFDTKNATSGRDNDPPITWPTYSERTRSSDCTITISNDHTRLRFGGRTLKEDHIRRCQRVEQLVQRRSQAFMRGEANVAHLIALELERTYQVSVDDTSYTWSMHEEDSTETAAMTRLRAEQNATSRSAHDHPDKFPLFPGILFRDEARMYDSPVTSRRSSLSLPLEDESWIIRVEDLLLERIHKREEDKYLEADAIRRELWYTYVSCLVLCWPRGFDSILLLLRILF